MGEKHMTYKVLRTDKADELIQKIILYVAEQFGREVALKKLDELEAAGRIFVIAPSTPVTVSRLEKDMEKLGALYWQGYRDTEEAIGELKQYLEL